jgi:hypothetical protein
MKLLTSLGTGLGLAVLCVLAAPNANADDWHRKTVVTFSSPVEVPGSDPQTLPAGTYVFKIVDSRVDRHIVQILNQDENHVFTTVMAIPRTRTHITSDTVITFRERPAGQPEALRAWYYPHLATGDEFVYPKTRATELAKETNETVLATPTTMAAAPVESMNTAPIEAVNPAGETVETAQVAEAPPAPAEPVAKPAPVQMASLPQTASDLGLIGLSGLMLLGAGFLIPALAKKTK